MQGDNLNISENVKNSLDHGQGNNYQLQKNSTILDTQHEIPPFNPETSLSFQSRDQMEVISHESQRLAQLGFADNTADRSFFNSNQEDVFGIGKNYCFCILSQVIILVQLIASLFV